MYYYIPEPELPPDWEELHVHPRVMSRHPNLTEEDVRSAWINAFVSRSRTAAQTEQQIALGVDGHGKLVELLARRLDERGWLIYHAQTPPSKKTLQELGVLRRPR